MKRFKKVYIEITNVCNLNCNFCPKTSRAPRFMEEEDFRRIIDEVKEFTDYIYLHLLGEPFLHPKLKRFLEIAGEKGLKVNITTNGVLIQKVKEVLIAASALRQVNISLSSFEANEDNICLEEYIENVADFIKESSVRSNIICSMRLWNMDSEELKGSNKSNPEILRLLEEKLQLDFKLADKLTEAKGIKLARNLYLNMAEKFSWPDINIKSEEEKVFCYGLRDQLGILVDGTVVPCCLDSEGTINLGNIFSQPLGEIIEAERSRAIFDGFSNRKAVEELCRKCGYAKRY